MENLQEEKVVALARSGNDEAFSFLLKKYNAMIKSIARRYFIIGFELEDMIQEGMIGFSSAISTFDSGKTTSFSSYAYLCIKRAVLDAVKKSNSQKHKNDFPTLSVNFQGVVKDEFGLFKSIVLTSEELLPDAKLISKENVEEILLFAQGNLSKFENQVLACYLRGLSYKEISKLLNKNEVSIENALSRLRKKMSNQFRANN